MEDRSLPYGSPLPAAWLAAIQEFIGSAAPNFRLTRATPQAVQVVAGTGSAQVGLGIDGLFRYITATASAAVTGAAGTYDVFATTGPNNFVPNPGGSPPENDLTNYAFALEVHPTGTSPTTSASLTNFRLVGQLSWDGAKITSLVPLVGSVDASAVFNPGDLKMSASSNGGLGWLLCDGSTHNQSQQPELYAEIGTTYGPGDGTAGSFSVPNYQGRVIVGAGAGAGLTARALGAVGGEETHALSSAEMPTHTHGVYDPTHGHGVNDPTHAHGVYDPTHSHGFVNAPPGNPGGGGWAILIGISASGSGYPRAPYNNNFAGGNAVIAASGTGIGIYGAYTGISIQYAATGIGIYNAGGGGAHNNMQPFGTANVFIKT